MTKKGAQVNLFNFIKTKLKELGKSRLSVSAIAFFLMFAFLVHRCFDLQIIHGQEYLDNYKLQIEKIREVTGTRGVIYDRNGNVLAENKLAFTVTIEDNGTYGTMDEKNQALNSTIQKVIGIIEKNGDSVINDFGIVLDSNEEYTYVAQSDSARLRFIADVFGEAYIDKLSEEQKSASASDLITYLCEDSVNGYGIDQKKMEKEEVLKLVNIRYAMSLNSYQKYIPTTIASDVKDETVAGIMENLDSLQGISVSEDSLRYYPDSKYFSSILGYTGKISQSEYDEYTEAGEKYSKTDIVGKAGIEKTMDSVLKGKNGKETLYVNNVGKIIEQEQTSAPAAGNNLYLTIDKDLQIATYKILEEQLAGIVVSNMSNVMNFKKTAKSENVNTIPFDDVLNSFFANSILDLKHFSSEDAKETEKAVYDKFLARKEKTTEQLIAELSSPNAKAYKDLSADMQEYMSFLANDVLQDSTRILLKDKIDTEDATYQAWRTEDSISLREFLQYAISKNWVDTSKLSHYLSSEGNYSDSNEVYEGLVSYLKEYLNSSLGYNKLIYKYMIKDGSISGREVCLMLYEQEILKYDEAQYLAVKSGKTSAYDFIRGKIQTLEITPGQLGLEPCTASAVVTDVNTGAVLACVSYPGYDNNRLANTMDSAYYSQLVSSSARPLYNNATQETTAPGSTFKMLSAVAGLTEGVINENTSYTCHGQFTKIVPSPKCWIYPGAHGTLNVVGAIQHSCNVFFSEMSYAMSKDSSGKFSNDQGLSILEKYAKMFGLDQKSGLEIPESAPEISSEDSVRSSFGQGTNNYTVSQLAKYVTTIANKGTLYDLTLLGKVETVDGEIIKAYDPKFSAELSDISDHTWNLVHQGMKNMVKSSQIFKPLRDSGFSMSGKTGTAQQSALHPDHALFTGFAPSDSPEIALAVRIANGDKSAFASEIGRDIVRYYFELADESQIIHNQASSVTSETIGD